MSVLIRPTFKHYDFVTVVLIPEMPLRVIGTVEMKARPLAVLVITPVTVSMSASAFVIEVPGP